MKVSAIFNVIYYYGIFVGVTSYHYDLKGHKYYQSTFTKYLATISNLVGLVILPLCMWLGMRMLEKFRWNILLTVVSGLHSAIQTLAAVFTILSRRNREDHIVGIVAELAPLRNDFFQHLPLDKSTETKYLVLFLLKVVGVIYIVLGDMISSLNLPMGDSWYVYVIIVLGANSMFVLPLTTIHYFQLMAFLSRYFVYLNKHLLEVLEHLRGTRDNQNLKFCQKQLHQAELVHWRVSRIACRLNAIYRFQMLASRLTCFMTTVSMGYYLFMFVEHSRPSLGEVALGIFTYAVMVFDLYLVDYIWYDVQQNHNATAGILREYIELPGLPPAIDEMCKLFAINLGTFKLRFLQIGLFEVDLRLWFTMMVSVIGYNLMLVQFDIVLSRRPEPVLCHDIDDVNASIIEFTKCNTR